MPDWKREAERRLEDTKYPAADREEVARELAGYLEDLCSDARHSGLDESAASDCALTELNNDARLGAKLRGARKENPMHVNDRTKHFWLSGMTMLFASAGLVSVLRLGGLQPYLPVVWLHGGPRDPHAIYWPLIIYYPWLCTLPFFGAAGAYWSGRAGGSRAVQAVAGFFSIFVLFAILLTVLFASFVIGGLIGDVSASNTLFPECAGVLVSWVVIPGVALLLGVFPFLFRWRNRKELVTAN